MESEATFPSVGGSHQVTATSSSFPQPQDARTYFQQVPAAGHTVENLLDASAAGIATQSDYAPQSAVDTVEVEEPAPAAPHHHHHLVGLAAGPTTTTAATAGAAEIMQQQHPYPYLDWEQLTYSAGDALLGPIFTTTGGMEEEDLWQGWRSGSDRDRDREPTPPAVVDAAGSSGGLGRRQSNPSFSWTWTGGAGGDPWPPAYNNKNKLHDYSIMTDAKPPAGSSDAEIIYFVKRQMQTLKQQHAIEVNYGEAEADELGPHDVRSYVTSLRLSSESHEPGSSSYGYWKEKDYRPIRKESRRPSPPIGFKRTFQYYDEHGTKTNWLANEYCTSQRVAGVLTSS